MRDIITFSALGQNGRLGNQLFQIAATVATALDNDLSFFFPKWEYAKCTKNYFPVFPNNGCEKPTHLYREPSFNYTKIDLSCAIHSEINHSTAKLYTLEGYFQSKKYFEKHEDFIRTLFIPSYDIVNKIFDKYRGKIINTCAVHVRRGDYVNNPIYHQLDMEYYNKNIQDFKSKFPKIRFVIFSDDIAWCKQHFSGPEFMFSEGNTDFEDLIYMSICDHQIIANSSFSWWGAFLNKNTEKIIVYPEKWFGEVARLDHSDLLYF